MANIPKMRTIGQLVRYFKDNDADTRITEHYLRMIIKSKKIPVYIAGHSRQLVNLDVLIDYLSQEHIEEIQEVTEYGMLRKVCE